MELEYLEDMNLYMGTSWDQVLDIINDPAYSKVFRHELQDFLSSKEVCFAFIGDIKIADPTSQGVLLIKANEGLEVKEDEDPVIYIESIAHASDIYHKIKRKEKKLGDFFKPYMNFIKTNFT